MCIIRVNQVLECVYTRLHDVLLNGEDRKISKFVAGFDSGVPLGFWNILKYILDCNTKYKHKQIPQDVRYHIYAEQIRRDDGVTHNHKEKGCFNIQDNTKYFHDFTNSSTIVVAFFLCHLFKIIIQCLTYHLFLVRLLFVIDDHSMGICRWFIMVEGIIDDNILVFVDDFDIITSVTPMDISILIYVSIENLASIDSTPQLLFISNIHLFSTML